MLEITPRTVRAWSRLGARPMLGQAIQDVADADERVIVLSADLGRSSGLARFRRAYPDRFYNVGIAEQNMIGVAAGLAREGHVAFATSFAPFLSMRASEQVRMNMGYMGLNVKAVALGSGVAMSFLGNSHYGWEDAAIMRAVPGMTVVSPADCAEILKTIRAAAAFDGPMYIRLTGEANLPIVYDEDYDFQIGRANTLRQGTDVALLAAGTMVHESLKAAEILEEAGISASVVNMHTLKPLDTDAVEWAVGTHRLLVSVEEHTAIGGLGGAIAEYKAGLPAAPPQLLLGLPDEYGPVGEHRYLLERFGLTAPQIAERIRDRLES